MLSRIHAAHFPSDFSAYARATLPNISPAQGTAIAVHQTPKEQGHEDESQGHVAGADVAESGTGRYQLLSAPAGFGKEQSHEDESERHIESANVVESRAGNHSDVISRQRHDASGQCTWRRGPMH